MEISSNEVSAAGSIIIATVPGVSVDDEITLINNADKKDICETAKMIAFGQLECHVKSGLDFASGPITVGV